MLNFIELYMSLPMPMSIVNEKCLAGDLVEATRADEGGLRADAPQSQDRFELNRGKRLEDDVEQWTANLFWMDRWRGCKDWPRKH